MRTDYLVVGTWSSELIYGERQTDKRSIKPAAELHSVVQNCLFSTMPPFSDTESQYILIYCGHCNVKNSMHFDHVHVKQKRDRRQNAND